MKEELIKVVLEMRERAEFAERTGGNAIRVIAWADRIEAIAKAEQEPVAWVRDVCAYLESGIESPLPHEPEHSKEARRLLSAAPPSDSAQVLVEALERLIRAYVNTLEAGHDRITSLGGDCDSVQMMEENDRNLIQARAALATYRESHK